jgi:hypothetical protein
MSISGKVVAHDSRDSCWIIVHGEYVHDADIVELTSFYRQGLRRHLDGIRHSNDSIAPPLACLRPSLCDFPSEHPGECPMSAFMSPGGPGRKIILKYAGKDATYAAKRSATLITFPREKQ